MENNITKTTFFISIFVIVISLMVFPLVSYGSGEFVILITTFVINLGISAYILVCEIRKQKERKRKWQNRSDKDNQ